MTTGYVLNNMYYRGTTLDDYIMVPQTTSTADYSYTYIPQYYTHSEVDGCWHRKSIFEEEFDKYLNYQKSIFEAEYIPQYYTYSEVDGCWQENELRDSIIDSEEFDKYLNEWSHNE